MKMDYVEQIEDLQIRTFRKIMSGIEFMQNYVNEPELFKSDSSSLKNFLIHSFCFLHPDFHYLSFLSTEDIDVEIIKVSHILQILPTTININDKLFDNMSKDDINKFWLKFFTLFKEQNKFSIDSICNITCENKIAFLKDIKSAFDYINYEIPVFEKHKLSSDKITAEINSWKQPLVNIINVTGETFLFDADSELMIDIDIGKLITDLKHMVLTFQSTKAFKNQQNNLECFEFFNNYISLSKDILQHKNNLYVVCSPVLDEITFKMLSNDNNLSGNLYYIKRCNNFLRTLKSKIKSLI